ncbi:MAG: Rrf2 family transcriptional regulator [Acidobacteriota bacterium]
MKITRHTDYALRLLMIVAVRSERTTVGKAADVLRVSRHHLVKIAKRLGELGYLELVRGKSGGVSLARPPREINVGRVFRELENSILVECFDHHVNQCIFAGGCTLEGAFRSAFEAFCAELDRVTLADLVREHRGPRAVLSLVEIG